MERIKRLWSNTGIKFTRQGLARMLFWGVIFLLGGIFVKLSTAFQSKAVQSFDAFTLKSLLEVRTGLLNGVAVDITALGSATVITLFTIAGVIVLLLSKDKFGALQLAVASIGNAFLSFYLKLFFERPRPSLVPHLVLVSNFSYPSGHSLTAASFYLTLALLGCKHLKTWKAQVILFGTAVHFILLIGVSRMYLGVHYPSDVVGGLCLGAAWALIIGWAVSLWERAQKQ